MITVGDKPVVCFDVDDTLIMWSKSHGSEISEDKKINIIHNALAFSSEFHQEHVNNIIRHKQRGHFVVVWSAGGGEWAETAVKALKISKYVDICMSKPSWYVDDMPCESWMGKRVFIHEEDDDWEEDESKW